MKCCQNITHIFLNVQRLLSGTPKVKGGGGGGGGLRGVGRAAWKPALQ